MERSILIHKLRPKNENIWVVDRICQYLIAIVVSLFESLLVLFLLHLPFEVVQEFVPGEGASCVKHIYMIKLYLQIKYIYYSILFFLI